MAHSLEAAHDRVFATAFDHAPPPPLVPGPLRRAAIIIGDLLGAVGVLLCIPLAILAIGAPIALFVRLVLWLVGML